MGRTLAGASGRGFRARRNAAGEIMRAATQGLSNRPVKYRENHADRPIRIGVAYRTTGGGASPPRMDDGRRSRNAKLHRRPTRSKREVNRRKNKRRRFIYRPSRAGGVPIRRFPSVVFWPTLLVLGNEKPRHGIDFASPPPFPRFGGPSILFLPSGRSRPGGGSSRGCKAVGDTARMA